MAHSKTGQPAVNSASLVPLRSHLAAIRRSRRVTRVACGLLALAVALVAFLIPLFLADWVFHFARMERAVLLLGLGAALVWSMVRWPRRSLWHIETELELALELEREQRIDGDLVAALQFDEAGLGADESPVLAAATIQRVAALTPMPLPENDSATKDLRRLAGFFLAATVLAGGISWRFPSETRVFLNRLCLGRARYPTRTVLTAITVNGVRIFPESASAAPLRAPYGRPVRFEVECAGDLPEDGTIHLAATRTEESGLVLLTPVPQQDASRSSDAPARSRQPAGPTSGSERATRTFAGEFPRLLETVSFSVEVGDVRSDPETIEPIPFPAVTLEMTTTPPAYAKARRQPVSVSGARQISVMEGSRLDLRLTCVNKRLDSARLECADVTFPLVAENDERQTWRLGKTSTPLDRIVAPLSFEISAVDADGLSPEVPLRCAVAIEPDRPPRVAAAVVTDKVLPSAEPILTWGATDDFGLAEVRLRWQIIHPGGGSSEDSRVLQKAAPDAPAPATLRGRERLTLADWRVSLGDEIRLSVEAVDRRGDASGKDARSDSIVLSVTDENGILAALADGDERSARELDELIQRELGIGESP
jgi:hypothetical protein